MRYEDAYKQLEDNLKELDESQNELCDFIVTLMECVEKQIAKPKHKYVSIRCVCGCEVAGNQDFCESCGQRLLNWKVN